MSQTFTKDAALEVFLTAFSATRSFTRPCGFRRLDDTLWMVADEDQDPKRARKSELIGYGLEPARVTAVAEAACVGRHMVCVLVDRDDELGPTVATFKQAGYRYAGHEPLFILDLDCRARFHSPIVRRVLTAGEAEAVKRGARTRQILAEHLTDGDPPVRLYAAFDGDAAIGWVRSIRTGPDRAWVSNMYVREAYRRAGLGRALMSAMLEDDAAKGVRWSVLLASSVGALLYPRLGYDERGLLLLFHPPRRRQSELPDSVPDRSST